MVHLASSILLGATGGINGGLIAAQALDKLHMSGSSTGLALSALGGFVTGLVLIAGTCGSSRPTS